MSTLFLGKIGSGGTVEQSDAELFDEAETAELSPAEAAELADALLFEEHKENQPREDQIRAEIIGKVIKRLKEDATRGEGCIDRDDVNRAYARLGLTIAECAEAEKAVLGLQIQIIDSDHFEDSNSHGSDTSNSVYLTADGERALARKIQLANQLTAAKAQLDDEFGNRVLLEAKQARDLFATTNQNYVRKLARAQRRTRHLTQDDLYQEGMLGLLKATETFDPDSGFRLKTYATWWIQQRILRAIDNDDRAVRLPVHLQEKVRKIKRFQRTVLLTTAEQPSIKQLADAVGMDAERLAKLLWRIQATDCVEGDAEIGEDATIFSFLPDELALSQIDILTLQELASHARAVLQTLSPREERILRLRFGFDNDEPKTLEAIGDQFNLTRERIRQIEAKALRRLKHPNRSRKLRAFLDYG